MSEAVTPVASMQPASLRSQPARFPIDALPASASATDPGASLPMPPPPPEHDDTPSGSYSRREPPPDTAATEPRAPTPTAVPSQEFDTQARPAPPIPAPIEPLSPMPDTGRRGFSPTGRGSGLTAAEKAAAWQAFSQPQRTEFAVIKTSAGKIGVETTVDLLVIKVEVGSAGEAAGLRQGMRVLEVGGRGVSKQQELIDTFLDTWPKWPAGEKFPIVCDVTGRPLEVTKEGTVVETSFLVHFADTHPEAQKLKMGVCIQNLDPREVNDAFARLVLNKFAVPPGASCLGWNQWKTFWKQAVVESEGKQDFVWRLIFSLLDSEGSGQLRDKERLLHMFYGEGSIFVRDGRRDSRLPEEGVMRQHLNELAVKKGYLSFEDVRPLLSGNHSIGKTKKEGILEQGGVGMRNWKKRYFVGDHLCMCYFAKQGDTTPKGVVTWGPGTSLNSEPTRTDHSAAAGSEARCLLLSFDEDGRRSLLLLRAASPEDKAQWAAFIEKRLEAAARPAEPKANPSASQASGAAAEPPPSPPPGDVLPTSTGTSHTHAASFEHSASLEHSASTAVPPRSATIAQSVSHSTTAPLRAADEQALRASTGTGPRLPVIADPGASTAAASRTLDTETQQRLAASASRPPVSLDPPSVSPSAPPRGVEAERLRKSVSLRPSATYLGPNSSTSARVLPSGSVDYAGASFRVRVTDVLCNADGSIPPAVCEHPGPVLSVRSREGRDVLLNGFIDWGSVRRLEIDAGEQGRVSFGPHIRLGALEILSVRAKELIFDPTTEWTLASLHTLKLNDIASLVACPLKPPPTCCGHRHLTFPSLSALSLQGVSIAAQKALQGALLRSVTEGSVGSVLGGVSSERALGPPVGALRELVHVGQEPHRRSALSPLGVRPLYPELYEVV
eukprot:Hpha_TRINITY_DN7726_c0_g1::TRINITY_DN7726_c0_g1_i1::g.85302::m.85302